MGPTRFAAVALSILLSSAASASPFSTPPASTPPFEGLPPKPVAPPEGSPPFDLGFEIPVGPPAGVATAPGFETPVGRPLWTSTRTSSSNPLGLDVPVGPPADLPPLMRPPFDLNVPPIPESPPDFEPPPPFLGFQPLGIEVRSEHAPPIGVLAGPVPVPEPATGLLVGLGLFGFGWFKRSASQ